MNSKEFSTLKKLTENKNSKWKERSRIYLNNMLLKLKNKYKATKRKVNNVDLNILRKVENLNKNFKKRRSYLNKLKPKSYRSCMIEEQLISIVPNQKEEKLFYEVDDQVDDLIFL